MGRGDESDEYEETAAARWEAAYQEPHAPPPDFLSDPVKSPDLHPSHEQHMAEARERSPEAPTGDERSTEWAMRFRAEYGQVGSASVDVPKTGFGDKYSLLPDSKGNLQTNLGFMTLWLDIMDRTTGAVGSFTLYGAQVSWGPLPGNAEFSTGRWKDFDTTEMSLRDFDEEIVRTPSLPFDLFKTLQFTGVDVEYEDPSDSLLYGDGVDVTDLGEGVLPIPELSYGIGPLLLKDLRWEPDDPWGGGFDPEAKRLDIDVFEEAFEEGLQGFVEEMTKSQLLPEAVARTAHEFEEILDQQSSPDPVSELQHEIAEEDAQQSLPPLPGPSMPDAGVSRLPDDAPTDFSDEQAFRDYSEQRTNLPPGVDPVEDLDQSLREQQVQASLPTEEQADEVESAVEHEWDEQQAQASLPTEGELAEQNAYADQIQPGQALSSPTTNPELAEPDSASTAESGTEADSTSRDATDFSDGQSDPVADLDQELSTEEAPSQGDAEPQEAPSSEAWADDEPEHPPDAGGG